MHRYKLINLDDKKHIPFKESDVLVDLWTMLDNSEFKYKNMVIVKNKQVIAGKSRAFEQAGRMGFTI